MFSSINRARVLPCPRRPLSALLLLRRASSAERRPDRADALIHTHVFPLRTSRAAEQGWNSRRRRAKGQ